MLNFPKETEKTAKNVDDAVKAAMEELKVTNREEVDVEIIEEGTKGFLGLGSKDASVRVKIKDVNAAIAKNFLESVFSAMGVEVAIDAQTKDDALEVDLSGERMGLIIGKRGETLDSLQYLTSLIVNHECDEYVKVVLDTENYREKREEALLSLAARLAAKVTRSGKKYTLEPMNPYERRIIHASLQDNAGVTTYSIGEDPYRKVVIAPKNAQAKKPYKAPAEKKQRKQDTYDYTESYLNYKKTAPRHDTVKKAENFEAYSAMESEE